MGNAFATLIEAARQRFNVWTRETYEALDDAFKRHDALRAADSSSPDVERLTAAHLASQTEMIGRYESEITKWRAEVEALRSTEASVRNVYNATRDAMGCPDGCDAIRHAKEMHDDLAALRRQAVTRVEVRMVDKDEKQVRLRFPDADAREMQGWALSLGELLEISSPFTSPASEVSCRCGMYTGACPLHDHDYRTDAEKAIEADRAARAKGPAR